jgi:hypothetical protein
MAVCACSTEVDMTQDEIIEMWNSVIKYARGEVRITEFAKLVAAKEREACAKIVEESSLPDSYSEECLPEIANDIRARGEA